MCALAHQGFLVRWTYCCPVTLDISKPNDLGDGRVRIHDDIRVTVELD